jgi:hypothetical protein
MLLEPTRSRTLGAPFLYAANSGLRGGDLQARCRANVVGPAGRGHERAIVGHKAGNHPRW